MRDEDRSVGCTQTPNAATAMPSYRDIGWAVKQMHNGCRVRRRGWNGRNMFLFLVPASDFQVNRPPLLGIYEEGRPIHYQAHVDMRTSDDTIVPWLCSQSDLLALDWEVVS